jgi:hypothetical protein
MKELKYLLFVILFFTGQIFITAQNGQTDVLLEPIEISGLGGVQSYAFGQHEGKWLIIGGRLDGLHRRQPFASFDVAGHNTDIIVIDPVQKKQWRKSNSVLPASIREQLSATNPEFHQEGDRLYIIGGYGFSATLNDHTTYANLCAVDVPQVINAVINNQDMVSFFRQIQHEKLAVTGGYLHKLYETYYLVGGQKFIGRYNPMGPDFGPGFFQEYTNAIRKFTLTDDGVNLGVTFSDEVYDEENLHRRDYNVAQHIKPDGTFGLTAFSGVFQKEVNLPFLNCVHIDTVGYTVQPEFNQYYNHYHCAHVPLYSSSSQQMHTLFFGGIAQYYDDNGVLTRDDEVPFVNTIARVTRSKEGNMTEHKLKSVMPGLLGSGSEFIIHEQIPVYENGVIKFDELIADTTHIGYIYGGINSSAPNIFFTNTGSQSSASNRIFKVFLLKNQSSDTDDLNLQSQNGLGMLVFPNPTFDNIQIKYELQNPAEVTLTIYSINGEKIKEYELGHVMPGKHQFQTNDRFENQHEVLLHLRARDKISVQKIILK